MGRYEPDTGGRGDVTDDIEEAAPVLGDEGGVGRTGCVFGPEDGQGLAREDSPRKDSMSGGTDVDKKTAALFAHSPTLDGQVFAAERARVFEAMFHEPAEPQRLGRYVVLGTLGRGGMGIVLEAFDRTLDRKVALKVLHEEFDDEQTARLLREAQAMAKLSHPNVVQVYEADTVGSQTFVAMELVQGLTLEEWMKQDPLPRWRQCIKVFIQVGRGLAAAHAQGLVHRDFKPGNAIVDDKGRARVLDFGLARWAEVGPTEALAEDMAEDLAEDERQDHVGGQTKGDRPSGHPTPRRATSRMMEARTMRVRGPDEPALEVALTKTGAVLGTPAYMPPEQMMGHEADARSDQFSFCIALYEAVYGERPFEGNSLATLMAAVACGEVRPAPKGSPVPAGLRAVLLRGLAVEPEQRWPSMEALLGQLQRLVVPRRGRWLALGAGIAVGLGLVGAGLAYRADMAQRCTGAHVHLDGIWDEERRQAVEAAILGTEVSYAPDTWERVESQLDSYANAWMDKHTEVCEATTVRGEQSDEAMRLRMRCLGQRRTSFLASVDVLAEADAEVVKTAVKLVAGLPLLTRCDDLDWLEQQDERVPPPEDPGVAAVVEAQRVRLADIEAMGTVGRYVEALDAVERVVQQAETLGYPPLWAEALYRRGQLREEDGQYTEAEQDLRKAHAMAVEHHHDPVVLDTAQLLTGVMGHRLERHVEGQLWGEMVALPLARGSGELIEVAKSLSHLGIVFYSQGDYDNAKVYYQQNLAILEDVEGPDCLGAASVLNNLGAVFVKQGDFDNAELHHQRALAIWENALGPNHPYVASSLNNLGVVFQRQGDLGRAELYHQRAIAMWESALGPNHPHLASGLVSLGLVLHSRGDLDDARRHFERARAIYERALGSDHTNVAMSLVNLGDVLHSQGDLDDARRHFERAQAIYEKVLDSDHPEVAYSLAMLATLALDEGDTEAARAYAERVISICEGNAVLAQLCAEALLVLAQVLWSERNERARARGLAEQARDALAAAEGPGDANIDLDEIEAWLATHRVE